MTDPDRPMACMGGWCRIRERCPHYGIESDEPAERLCKPGRDGEASDFPVQITFPAGEWVRRPQGHAAPASWLNPLAP